MFEGHEIKLYYRLPCSVANKYEKKGTARQRWHKALVAGGEAAPLCEQTGPELSVRKWHGVWSPLSHAGEGVQLQYPLAKSEVLKSNSLVRYSGAHQSPSFEDKETSWTATSKGHSMGQASSLSRCTLVPRESCRKQAAYVPCCLLAARLSHGQLLGPFLMFASLYFKEQ